MSVRTTDHVTIPAAALDNREWRKSSRSGHEECVELTFLSGGEEGGMAAIRDSKSLGGEEGDCTALVLPRAGLASLVRFTSR